LLKKHKDKNDFKNLICGGISVTINS